MHYEKEKTNLTYFRRQSYGDFSPIPNNRAKSSPTCCDTIRQMRQTALTPQNPVARHIKIWRFQMFFLSLH